MEKSAFFINNCLISIMKELLFAKSSDSNVGTYIFSTSIKN